MPGRTVDIRRDQQIDLALVQLLRRLVRGRQDIQLYPGCACGEPQHQRNQHGRGDVIRGDNLESPLRLSRVEARRCGHQRFEPLQAFAHLGQQSFREGGREHLFALWHEDVVAEVAAQSGERGAHRRLAQVHADRGARHAARFEQRLEGHQQVQVQTAEAHFQVSTKVVDVDWNKQLHKFQGGGDAGTLQPEFL